MTDMVAVVVMFFLFAAPVNRIERLIRPWPQWTVPFIVYPVYLLWIGLMAWLVSWVWVGVF